MATLEPEGRLTPSQVGRLLATFRTVDDLLLSVQTAARGTYSPFDRTVSDLDPDEVRLLESFLESLRRRMVRSLDRLGIPRPAPSISARWSIETALGFADINLSELDARALRAYGAVDPEAGREVDAVSAELRRLITQGLDLVRQGRRDQGTPVAQVPRPVGEVLQRLDRLSRERGLFDLQPLLAAAAERALADSVDVAVFGRVGAGKSSLINALAGTPALPVGATPVTAVPLRLRHGDPEARVALREGPDQIVGLDQIARFATEADNPDNGLGVRQLDIAVPTLPEGLRLIDTPGVGSLAGSGPAQAFAWLPRCDLGLVLVAAGAAVGLDEVAMVAGLARAGIACQVLVSKADLLADGDRQRVVEYVERELREAAGPGVTLGVRPISSLPEHRAQVEALFRDVITPLMADRRRTRAAALRLRVSRLITLAGAALQGQAASAEHRIAEAHRIRTAAEREVRRIADELSRGADRVLEAAGRAVQAAWADARSGQGDARRAILAECLAAAQTIQRTIDSAREQVGAEASDRGARIPPVFDPPFLEQLPPLDRPRLLPAGFARSAAARALRHLEAPLRAALERFADRLAAWGQGRLDELDWEVHPPEPATTLPPELEQLEAMLAETAS